MLPDVVGYTTEKGEQLLKKSGYMNVHMHDIKSPKSESFEQKEMIERRIIRVKKVNNDTVSLWVCDATIRPL